MKYVLAKEYLDFYIDKLFIPKSLILFSIDLGTLIKLSFMFILWNSFIMFESLRNFGFFYVFCFNGWQNNSQTLYMISNLYIYIRFGLFFNCEFIYFKLFFTISSLLINSALLLIGLNFTYLLPEFWILLFYYESSIALIKLGAGYFSKSYEWFRSILLAFKDLLEWLARLTLVRCEFNKVDSYILFPKELRCFILFFTGFYTILSPWLLYLSLIFFYIVVRRSFIRCL